MTSRATGRARRDRLLLRRGHRQRPRPPHQPLQHALAHLQHVGLALAQVRILDLLELLDEHAHLQRKRPLGVAALLGDDTSRQLGQRRVVEEHPVHVEERAELAWRVAARQCRVQPLELALHFVDGGRKALDFRRDLRQRDRVVGDLARRMRHQVRAADRNAARDADAVQREAHHARTSRRDGGGTTTVARVRRKATTRSPSSPRARRARRSRPARSCRRPPPAA